MPYEKFALCFLLSSLYSFIEIPLSTGDCLDKYSILNIKMEYVSDEAKQKNILYELSLLDKICNEIIFNEQIKTLYDKLITINRELWNIESEKRACETSGIHDVIVKVKNGETLSPDEHKLLIAFLYLARQVYIKNDQRAQIKKQINIISGSDIIEEKSHF
jgi:hypothetical protein